MPLTTDEILEIARMAWDKVSGMDDNVSLYDTYAIRQDFMDEFRRRLQRVEENQDAQN